MLHVFKPKAKVNTTPLTDTFVVSISDTKPYAILFEPPDKHTDGGATKAAENIIASVE